MKIKQFKDGQTWVAQLTSDLGVLIDEIRRNEPALVLEKRQQWEHDIKTCDDILGSIEYAVKKRTNKHSFRVEQ